MTTSTELLPGTYLSHLRSDAARMSDVAVRDIDAAVPTCPGWTVREAIVHTGEVYSHKVACMRVGQRPDDDDYLHEPGDAEDPVAWFRDRLDELVGELQQRGPDAPSYTWFEPRQTVGFWYRRMAQETAVHRVDVESAFDGVTPVDDDLAVDGIDEVLDWFLAYQAEDVGPDGPGRGTVAVRTGDHIWRVALTADDVELSREPGPADAVASGEPSELLLWLWGRRPDSAVTTEGDAELLGALRERLRVVTQ
ncbi:MAG: maleylpyruvate isomerase family mycothiol-dependent enzyme [Actinomycetes bacterium]